MRKLLESLDDIIDGEPVGVEKPAVKPKSSSKFLGKPYKRGEDEQEVTETDDEEDGDEKDLKESLKAQFEDYVKNKAVPDSKKELKLEKQDDGSYQVKNEKGAVVCRGTKSDCQTHITKKNAELNDAKLDEAAKWRADDLEDKVWSRDEETGDKNLLGKNAGYPGDELTQRPGSWAGNYKRMTKKGVPTKMELGMQNNTKHRIKQTHKQGGLTGPKGPLGEAKGDTIEAHGIRGMDRKSWQRTFKNVDALNAWCEKYDAECHGTRDTESAAQGRLLPAVGVKESVPSSKSEKMAKLKAILDKVSAELKNTRKKIGDNKKVTEAPIDQQVPQAAGNTVQAAPGVVQAAGQAQQATAAPANQQGAVPANQAQQQPKPAPGQPQAPAQQAPSQPGQQTAAPAPGQQKPPAVGQAGGAPVAQPPGTPAPAQGSAVNAATTPAEQVKGLVQTLATNPAAAKQLGTKLNTVMK